MVEPSTPDTDLQAVDILMLSGDIDGALALLDELRQVAGAGDPAVAWRTGVVHYLLRGSPREALAGMRRADLGDERSADEAMLLAWLASAHWALGDMAACAEHAVRAGAAAERCDDDRARAAAHVSLGLRAMLAGDRIANAAHHAKALRFAASAGDVIQQIRVRMNQASHYMEEAQFDDALTDLGIAVRLADTSGNQVLLAVALTNEGDALNALGRLAEAEKRFRRSIEICQRMESGKICFALLGLGDVLRRRGQHALARAAYEEVVPLAEQHGQVQILVQALAGLSDVLAETDSAAAVELATRARAEAIGPFLTAATLALARAVLAGGDREAAAGLAEQAQALARTHRDRVGVARALEMQAETCDGWERAGRHLAEARAIWTDVGAGFDADRVMVALARLPMVTSETYIDANLAAERLVAAGLPTAALHRAGDPTSRASIRTLGRFEVMVAGKVIPPAAWQSRKARDLLRLLVARRGRPATREELTELLWADEPVAGTDRRGHRLAVALSIIRGVLDGTRSAADSVVLTDDGSVALDTARIMIDLETFLRQADHGLRLSRRGQAVEGRAVLVAAERLYTGDFLEGESYEDWAAVPREQARATYLRVGRALAEDALHTGDTGEAIHYLLRILAMDGYDEQSHLDLVEAYSTAGRHGEARRARDRYAAAMAQIGVGVRG